MRKKELIEQFKEGGQETLFKHSDVLTLLDQIDEDDQDYMYIIKSVSKMIERSKQYDQRTVSCIVIEGKAKSKAVVKTFMAKDFITISNDKLILSGEDTIFHLTYTEIESIILQLNGKLEVGLSTLYASAERYNQLGYWD